MKEFIFGYLAYIALILGTAWFMLYVAMPYVTERLVQP